MMATPRATPVLELEQSEDHGPPFDVLLLGRAGLGKSTTGNTLLQAKAPRSFSREWFECKPGAHSVTKSCKLLTNHFVKPHWRVLDSQGFAPSDALSGGHTIYQANLAILREILTVQARENLAFKRILYFVPGRGPPERADSTLQEEISVMYYFFGTTIFENMVLVATVHRSMSTKNQLSETVLEEGREIFQEALKAVMKDSLSENQALPERIPKPPMIYLSLQDKGEELLDELEEQNVEHSNGLHLEFMDDVCARCATKLMAVEGKRAYAVGENDEPIVYTDTLCHPAFINKYGKTEKIIGGISIIITLGLAKVAGVPWFTNSEEVCMNHQCHKPPGSGGCLKVGEKYELSAVMGNLKAAKTYITSDHTNML